MNIAGCKLLGPSVLRGGRSDYNEAIKTTDVEQLLLNIVRLRYNDQPYFLQIASISSSAELAARLGAGAVFGDVDSSNIDGGLTYLEKPSIIYQPLTGEKFVQQLLKPLDLSKLLFLQGAGWEFDDIMRIFQSAAVERSVIVFNPEADKRLNPVPCGESNIPVDTPLLAAG